MKSLRFRYRKKPSTKARKKVRESTFDRFYTRVFEICEKHGPTGPGGDAESPWYYVVGNWYGDLSLLVEIHHLEAITTALLDDMRAMLSKYSDASVVFGVDCGCGELFQDELVATGPTFANCKNLADWMQQARRSQLIRAALENCKDDAAILQLQQFDELRTQPFCLSLSGKKVTDAGMAALKDLKGMTDLDLERTKVTDKGLQSLQAMTDLKYLTIHHAQVTDKGLKALQNMAGLRWLELRNTEVKGAGLAYLTCEDSLTELDLGNSKFSDRHASQLARFTNLESLRLDGTQVSDASLRHIQELNALDSVDLTRTKVSRKARKAIEQQL